VTPIIIIIIIMPSTLDSVGEDIFALSATFVRVDRYDYHYIS